MSATPLKFFATAPRGLGDLLASELSDLGLKNARARRGGVEFSGLLADAYKACLWSRLANRILFPLHSFEARNDEELYRGVRALRWQDHLGVDSTLAVDFTGVRPAITHSRFAAQRVKDGIVDQLRDRLGARPSVDLRQPDVRIHVHMERSQVELALDLSGDSLHRRGYRLSGVPAPLKENLAAAMLMRAGWPELAAAGGGMVDPMCGSGTLAIEAAWMALDTAPGLLRTHYGFQRWRGHDDEAWKALIDEALERQDAAADRVVRITAFDHDRSAVRHAMAGVEQAGLTGRIHVERRELAQAEPPAGTRGGLVAVNPPYGERMADDEEARALFAELGQVLRERFGGWRAIVLNGAGARVGLVPERSWQMFNGPLECRLERFEIAAPTP